MLGQVGIGLRRRDQAPQRNHDRIFDQHRKVGGVELDVTFENLALLGVPEMRVTGPANCCRT
jgi:hypothetical protein